jgi:steroid delta-isomerase-like uncharacterized protein
LKRLGFGKSHSVGKGVKKLLPNASPLSLGQEARLMIRRQKDQKSSQRRGEMPSALEVTADYVAALAARDSARMNTLRSPNFILDFVHAAASEEDPLSVEETMQFWSAWFVAFPELDYQVTRTIAAETVVVTQWVFSGTNSGPLGPPLLASRAEPFGRTIRLRGVSIYDVSEGLIQRETAYIDFATLMVELGVEL